ncbi:MAG: AAA family ATPase [Candidatus Marinimicrobia bacterium]|nr:AAA family ATPase [Candidatus Neomarinimicrobiota bacterium]MBT7339088.1 AAA family ATPase [Candidatus Jacksonbacteria bacterium]
MSKLLNKVLFFDFEKGSKTLGNNTLIEDLFGYPVLRPDSWAAFEATIAQLFDIKIMNIKKKLANIDVVEPTRVLLPKEGVPLDALVLDTFSELAKKYQRTLVGKDGKLKIDGWGKLKNAIDMKMEDITRIPCHLIVNVHAKKDNLDDGSTPLIPYIDGSSKEDLAKWFDFVVYTKTVPAPGNKLKFMWHINKTSTFAHAKDRTQTLPAEIPQDYRVLLDAAKKAGWPNAKILVIGTPGSGKTKSLETLVQEIPDTKAKEEKS